MRAEQETSTTGGTSLEHRIFSPQRVSVPDLQALVDDVLRSVVAAVREGTPQVRAVVNRDPMRELCAAARAGEVRAETVILAIKDGWRRLPESQGGIRLDAEATLATVITGCIREYYAPRRA